MNLFLISFVIAQVICILYFKYSPKPQKEAKIKSIEDLDIETQKEYLSYLEALKNGKKILIRGNIYTYENDIICINLKLFNSPQKNPISLKSFEQEFISSLEDSKESLLLDNAINNHKTRIQNYEVLMNELKK